MKIGHIFVVTYIDFVKQYFSGISEYVTSMNFLGHITMYSVSTSVSFPSNRLPIFYSSHTYRKMERGWKEVGREGKEKDIRIIFSRLVQFVVHYDTFGHFWSSHLPA